MTVKIQTSYNVPKIEKAPNFSKNDSPGRTKFPLKKASKKVNEAESTNRKISVISKIVATTFLLIVAFVLICKVTEKEVYRIDLASGRVRKTDIVCRFVYRDVIKETPFSRLVEKHQLPTKRENWVLDLIKTRTSRESGTYHGLEAVTNEIAYYLTTWKLTDVEEKTLVDLVLEHLQDPDSTVFLRSAFDDVWKHKGADIDSTLEEDGALIAKLIRRLQTHNVETTPGTSLIVNVDSTSNH